MRTHLEIKKVNMKNYREFWISINQMITAHQAYESIEGSLVKDKSKLIHVIEKSAYDDVRANLMICANNHEKLRADLDVAISSFEKLRDGICNFASDTAWYSASQTAVEYIDETLARLTKKEQP